MNNKENTDDIDKTESTDKIKVFLNLFLFIILNAVLLGKIKP